MDKKSDFDHEDLVKSSIKGNEKAMNELLVAIKDPFYRFCLYLTGDAQRANDVFQETLIRVVEKIETLRDPKQFKSWLFMIAKNQFLNLTRYEKIREYKPLEDHKGEAPDVPGDTAGLALEVEAALKKLEESDRQILILVDLEGLSYSEAADFIGISESAVRSRLFRARQRFINEFDG